MRVHKFGGASLSTPEAIDHMAEILLEQGTEDPIIIVVSAIGKTTNALERTLEEAMHNPGEVPPTWQAIRDEHLAITSTLAAGDPSATLPIERMLNDLALLLQHLPTANYDTLYDLIVPHGELLSSLIVAQHVARRGLPAQWVDVRKALRSDPHHRAATVNLALSQPLAQQVFPVEPKRIYITQGFIASTPQGVTTTLGREGSDYTAALLGAFLQAKSVTIWKDVPGFLNADPKLFPQAIRIPKLDYREAIEMSFNGAKIIHPKALKPLQNAEIPLYVRAFATPDAPGTIISNFHPSENAPPAPPLFAVREEQMLLSLTPRDLSFALQNALGIVFDTLYTHHVRVHLIQNSAVSLSLCLENDPHTIPPALEALQSKFHIAYNTNLVLLSIRHYTPELALELANREETLLQQTTRLTGQYLYRKAHWEEQIYPAIRAAIARISLQLSSAM